MCDVPSIAVFCSESTECFPGMASKFFLKTFVNIPVPGTILHFRLPVRCISIRKVLYCSFFSLSLCKTFLYVGIATSRSTHVISFVLNYYIWPFCCNFSVCVYCLIPQYCNSILFIHWLGLCIWKCAQTLSCLIKYSFFAKMDHFEVRWIFLLVCIFHEFCHFHCIGFF